MFDQYSGCNRVRKRHSFSATIYARSYSWPLSKRF